MRLFESFGNDDKQKKVSAENSITEEKTGFEIQHGKGTGLLKTLGKRTILSQILLWKK